MDKRAYYFKVKCTNYTLCKIYIKLKYASFAISFFEGKYVKNMPPTLELFRKYKVTR